MVRLSIVVGVGLAAASTQACADRTSQPTHTARGDCAGAERPKLPDGKSVLTCEKDENGFHWIASQSPEALASCPSNAVLLLGCTNGERGRVCIRTPDGDGGFKGSEWMPVCR